MTPELEALKEQAFRACDYYVSLDPDDDKERWEAAWRAAEEAMVQYEEAETNS